MTEPIVIRSTDGVITQTDDISDVHENSDGLMVMVVEEFALGRAGRWERTGEMAILPLAHIVKVTVPAELAHAVRSPEPDGSDQNE